MGLLAITSTLASAALGVECVIQCLKNSKHEQEMYPEKSKQNPFRSLGLKKVPKKKFHLSESWSCFFRD